MLRDTVKALGLDFLVFGGLSAAKEALKPVFQGFAKTTGEKIGDETFDRVMNGLLGKTEQDEGMIDRALPLLDYRTQHAWHNKANSFADADHREFYRRLKCRETPQETADALKNDADMPQPLWEEYQRSVVADYRVATKFVDYLKTQGQAVWGGLKTHHGKVNQALDQIADAGESWLADFKSKRGIR